MSSEPDYEKYSREELLDVYKNIDRDNYPERFKKIMWLLGMDISDSEEGYFDADPKLSELNKTRRIKNYFDSLNDSGSEFHSDTYDSGDGFYGDGADGGGE